MNTPVATAWVLGSIGDAGRTVIFRSETIEAAKAARPQIPVEVIGVLLGLAFVLAIGAWWINSRAKRAEDPVGSAERLLCRKLRLSRSAKGTLDAIARDLGVPRLALLASPHALREALTDAPDVGDSKGRAALETLAGPGIARVGVTVRA